MNRPSWTLAEAVERCSVSRSTLKRRLSAGELPNAYKAGNGQWRIPITDLISAGYDPGKVEWSDPEQPTPSAAPEPQQEATEARLRELEKELAQERLRRSNAEQIAEERRARIEDLQMAMRLLEAPSHEGGSHGRSPGSNRWVTDLAHEPSRADHDLAQDASPQVTSGSHAPPVRTTELGHNGPPDPPQRRSWWSWIVGKQA